MEKKYIYYKFPTSLSGWRERWFYIGNHEPFLPERTVGALKITTEWSKPCQDKARSQAAQYDKKVEGCTSHWCDSDVLLDWQATLLDFLQTPFRNLMPF
jgi:hypothetical protein